MGSTVSKKGAKDCAATLPASIAPLNAIESIGSSHDKDGTITFSFPWHTQEGTKRTLSLPLDNRRRLEMKCSAFHHALQLHRDDDNEVGGGGGSNCASPKTICICMRTRRFAFNSSFGIYTLQPNYPNQTPVKWKRHKGGALYLYATLSSNQQINFVHEPLVPALQIVPEPKSSRTKMLVGTGQAGTKHNMGGRFADTVKVATWKRQNYPSENDVTILPSSSTTANEPCRDIAFVICVVYLSEFLDVDRQMYQQFRRGYWSG